MCVGGRGWCSAVATRGWESVPPLPTSVYVKYCFGTSRNDKTTDNDGNIRIITFKHNFRLTISDSSRNCWQSTAAHKCGTITSLITVTRLYACVVEERITLQNRYRYFDTDYEMQTTHENMFFQRPAFFDFLRTLNILVAVCRAPL